MRLAVCVTAKLEERVAGPLCDAEEVGRESGSRWQGE